MSSSKLAGKVQFVFRYQLDDLGVPNYSCPGDLMKPSKSVPTNVNSVRPADIKLVMNLGDSLSVRGVFLTFIFRS